MHSKKKSASLPGSALIIFSTKYRSVSSCNNLSSSLARFLSQLSERDDGESRTDEYFSLHDYSIRRIKICKLVFEEAPLFGKRANKCNEKTVVDQVHWLWSHG